MVLHYKFKYCSNNNMLVNLLVNCSKSFALEYRITRQNNIINLFAEASIEILHEFSEKLSKYIPMSIFFKEVEVKNINTLPKESIEIKDESHLLTFCLSCLTKVEDKSSTNYYNPFIVCKDCGQDLDVNNFKLFEGVQELKKSNYIEYFEALAKLINDGKKVEIKTLSGDFVFSKMDLIEEKYQDRVKLLCTNLSNIHEVVNASKAEVIALASVEKPSLELKISEMFKLKNIFKERTIEVRYANDMILYLLSRELEKYNISFLAYIQNVKYDAILSYDTNSEFKQLDVPKIKLLESGQTLMLENKNVDKNLVVIYKRFSEKSKAQFMVLLTENNLFEKSILNFYASSKHDDAITLYSTKIDGVVDILKYQLPTTINDIYEEIKKDEIGEKLVNNYKNKFSSNYEKSLCFEISSIENKSIFSLWKIVSIILGFDDCVINNANKAMLDKGPRIDYKLFESDKVFNKEFNLYRLIRSCISYKLAGVDEKVICLGCAESFAHFISNCVDLVNEEFSLDGISLCGDLFADRVISHFVHKAITKNYEIYYNKDFVIQVD